MVPPLTARLHTRQVRPLSVQSTLRHTTDQSPRVPERGLPADVPASIVVATLDCPRDLETCLRALASQVTSRPVEVVVMDNNPLADLDPLGRQQISVRCLRERVV